MKIRKRLWDYLRRRHPQGQILTVRLQIIFAILFPLDCIYWKMSEAMGYQIETDTWLIEGIRYSGGLFRGLGFGVGEDVTFKIIKREDGLITISTTRDDQQDPAAGD